MSKESFLIKAIYFSKENTNLTLKPSKILINLLDEIKMSYQKYFSSAALTIMEYLDPKIS